MPSFLKGRSEQALTALVITLVLLGMAALVPAIGRQLAAKPVASPTPGPTRNAPPAAVLLPDELDKALEGVMTLANDHTFGTAFLIDGAGDFVTASSLVQTGGSLRLVDNTGGTHQVRLVGTDSSSGIAMVRTTVDGSALSLGSSAGVLVGDPLVLLASPKIANLKPSNPATVADEGAAQWRLQVDDLPGNLGGPVVGPGARVVGVLVTHGSVLPIASANAEIISWQALAGTPVPLAPFPTSLQLRGSDTTTAPRSALSVQSVNPARVSTAHDTAVSVQGNGFLAGSALRVRFLPVAGSNGAFDGTGSTVVNVSTITTKIPAGRAVQDYVIELINGNGAVVDSRIAMTVTP